MRNPKLYLVESEVPRVKNYLGLTKARSQPESAVLSVWDEQKLVKSINTKSQVLRKIGKKDHRTVILAIQHHTEISI